MLRMFFVALAKLVYTGIGMQAVCPVKGKVCLVGIAYLEIMFRHEGKEVEV